MRLGSENKEDVQSLEDQQPLTEMRKTEGGLGVR